MEKLSKSDIWSLEQYEEVRTEYRKKAMLHKAKRRLQLGPNAALQFEDRFSMKYQIQEILRAERIFKSSEIQEEIDTYNALIPEENSWIAVLLFEYEDATERALALSRMPEIEHRVFARFGESEPVFAIANEDLERTNEQKTAAVHFLRFQLSSNPTKSLQKGVALSFGLDDLRMPLEVVVGDTLRKELMNDLVD